MCVYGHFLYYSWSSKFIPKVGRHYGRFCLTTAITKKMANFCHSFFKILNVFLAVFPLKHILPVWRVIFCMILIAFAKWATLPLCKIASFFEYWMYCKPFSHRESLFISRVFKIFSYLEYLVFFGVSFALRIHNSSVAHKFPLSQQQLKSYSGAWREIRGSWGNFLAT